MADFKTAFLITIDDDHEGGFQKMPNDSGNWTSGIIGVGELKGTKYGISAHEYPNLDIENLTVDDAMKLYDGTYWKQNYSQINSQLIANKLFDLGVLDGVHAAVSTLQGIFERHNIIADGIFGSASLEIVNRAEPVGLLTAYKTALVNRAVRIVTAHPEKRPFFAGWVRRINS